MIQPKLGRHQKTILQILNKQTQHISDLPVTVLSWAAARTLEKTPGSHIMPSLNKNGYTLTQQWRATFSRCLRRLEDRGLIKRTPTPTSGRTHRITLTKEGREYARALEAT